MGDISNRDVTDETLMRTNKVSIPDEASATLTIGDRQLHLTNLQKVFWSEDGFTKRDLLQYYADIASILLPHLSDRAMVMKRYPNGYAGEFFFMKRTPSPKPSWLQTCPIEHASGNIIDFPMIQDLPALLWVINLGCIDLNQWYARCDDVHRPDYLHFDLDPVDETASFDKVLETAQIIHHELDNLKIPNLAKTTGLPRRSCVCSSSARPTPKTSLDVCEALRAGARRQTSESDYGGVSHRQASQGTRACGLQPERVGTNACVCLFRQTQARGSGFSPRDLGGN
jgi:hypothetical protein